MKAIRELRRAVLMVVVVCLLCAIPARGQAEFPVATKTLKNGMKVLVQTDHSIPNVALYIFYRIGSRNEGPGTTGISHFFEHMMFKGTQTLGTRNIEEDLKLNLELDRVKGELRKEEEALSRYAALCGICRVRRH